MLSSSLPSALEKHWEIPFPASPFVHMYVNLKTYRLLPGGNCWPDACVASLASDVAELLDFPQLEQAQ